MAAVKGGSPRHGAASKSPEDRVAPEELVKRIEEYLAPHPAAAVLEDGRVLFEMRTAHFSVTEPHGRCRLQLWNEEAT